MEHNNPYQIIVCHKKEVVVFPITHQLDLLSLHLVTTRNPERMGSSQSQSTTDMIADGIHDMGGVKRNQAIDTILEGFLPKVLGRIIQEYMLFAGHIVQNISLGRTMPDLVTFTRQHMVLIVGGHSALEFCNPITAERIKQWETKWTPMDMCVTPTGQLVVLTNNKHGAGSIHIFDGMEQKYEIRLSHGPWTSMAIRGNEVIVHSHRKQSISIFDLSSQAHVRDVQLDRSVSGYAMKTIPQGLLITDIDNLVLFDPQTGKTIRTFEHPDLGDGRGIEIWDNDSIVVSDGDTLAVFCVTTGQAIAVYHHDGLRPTGLTMRPGGHQLAICSHDDPSIFFME